MWLFCFSPGKHRRHRDTQLGLRGAPFRLPLPHGLHCFSRNSSDFIRPRWLTLQDFIWNTFENGRESSFQLQPPGSAVAQALRASLQHCLAPPPAMHIPVYYFHYADCRVNTHMSTLEMSVRTKFLRIYNTGSFSSARFNHFFLVSFYPFLILSAHSQHHIPFALIPETPVIP